MITALCTTIIQWKQIVAVTLFHCITDYSIVSVSSVRWQGVDVYRALDSRSRGFEFSSHLRLYVDVSGKLLISCWLCFTQKLCVSDSNCLHTFVTCVLYASQVDEIAQICVPTAGRALVVRLWIYTSRYQILASIPICFPCI